MVDFLYFICISIATGFNPMNNEIPSKVLAKIYWFFTMYGL